MLRLFWLPEPLAVARLEGRVLPGWVQQDECFLSITRTREELSVVCEESRLQEDVRAERGWFAFGVQGPLDFSLTGILASLAQPLAEAGISLFAVSTFDTDYVLIRAGEKVRAEAVLTAVGHRWI